MEWVLFLCSLYICISEKASAYRYFIGRSQLANRFLDNQIVQPDSLLYSDPAQPHTLRARERKLEPLLIHKLIRMETQPNIQAHNERNILGADGSKWEWMKEKTCAMIKSEKAEKELDIQYSYLQGANALI